MLLVNFNFTMLLSKTNCFMRRGFDSSAIIGRSRWALQSLAHSKKNGLFSMHKRGVLVSGQTLLDLTKLRKISPEPHALLGKRLSPAELI